MKINDKYPPGTLFSYGSSLNMILKWAPSHYIGDSYLGLLLIVYCFKTNKIHYFCHETTFKNNIANEVYKIYEESL